MNACQIKGCTAPVLRGKLLCLSHWRAVPIYLQNPVYRTWAVFVRASKPNRKIAALRAYRKARDAAIAHFTSVKA